MDKAQLIKELNRKRWDMINAKKRLEQEFACEIARAIALNYVSQTELSKGMGVTRETIRVWTRRGMGL